MFQSFGPIKKGQDKKIHVQAMEEALKVFPLSEDIQKKVLSKYGWYLSMQILFYSRELKESSRIAKTYRMAQADYLGALDSAFSDKKITITHWKRAGQAMEKVFQQSLSR
ncbi:MAG: hypothetical protein IJV07_00185 [Alphaproteobacteria bacterium]|nr:hypothetical protein [Alphaproteobacteria bacterium]